MRKIIVVEGKQNVVINCWNRQGSTKIGRTKIGRYEKMVAMKSALISFYSDKFSWRPIFGDEFSFDHFFIRPVFAFPSYCALFIISHKISSYTIRSLLTGSPFLACKTGCTWKTSFTSFTWNA